MKKRDFLIIALIFLSVFSVIMNRQIGNFDELWNYNTARVISEGLIPYRDISMITTPLLSMITAVFLNISINEVLISRILAASLWTGILYLVLLNLRLITKKENISFIFTAIIAMICRKIFYIDYNLLSLLFALIILYQELKNIDKDKNLFETSNKYNLLIRYSGRISNMYKTNCWNYNKYSSYSIWLSICKK